MSSPDERPHVPAPSLWPIGFAVGVAVLLVGLVVSLAAAILGAIIAVVFGILWVADTMRSHAPAAAPAVADMDEEDDHAPETYGRSAFLTGATIGIGGVIGAGVTLPSLGFAVLPSFTGANIETNDVDLGPIANFPEGQYVIATYTENPEVGDVSRRTAYIRNNGRTEKGDPSFTIIFSRCVHLGCPVQPNGPLFEDKKVTYKDVTLTPVQPAGFGCPCHGGAYDTEGNRTAGPPVRSLDRYLFSIKNGNLVLGKLYSVGNVEGAGAGAKIMKYRHAYPGVHVDGVERWLYPIPVPGA